MDAPLTCLLSLLSDVKELLFYGYVYGGGLYYLAHPHANVLRAHSAWASLKHIGPPINFRNVCIHFLKESERAYPQALPVPPSVGRVRQT